MHGSYNACIIRLCLISGRWSVAFLGTMGIVQCVDDDDFGPRFDDSFGWIFSRIFVKQVEGHILIAQ